MDEVFENPNTVAPRDDDDEDGQSSGEEDGTDWTKLQKMLKVSVDRPAIPKRGEKEFEPQGGPSAVGSNLQRHTLERSRDAMYSALKAERGISSRTISYGLWFPATSHTEVTLARGTMFSHLGYSNSRPQYDLVGKAGKGGRKRTELLPEEALYLIERGSLYCWRIDGEDTRTQETIQSTALGEVNLEDVCGAPMSVQQAYAEMIGRTSELTTEKYQVYAYLKRLGYNVIRAKRSNGLANYPLAAQAGIPALQQSIWQRTVSWLTGLINRISGLWRPTARIDWNSAIGLRKPYWWTSLTPRDVFKNLRVIPGGHKVPLQVTPPPGDGTNSPYEIFYHIYKPSTSFKKSAPPPPDFYVAVVDARNTTIPTLLEMSNIFSSIPVMPLPPPRKRNPIAAGQSEKGLESVPPPPPPPPQQGLSVFLQNLKAFFLRNHHATNSTGPPRKKGPSGPNPFIALKAGNKNFIVAAVDSGSISFIRFSEGCFEDWPMV